MQNTYIQYVNSLGHIKTKDIVFVSNDGNFRNYQLSGINEDFFIIAVFVNNKRVLDCSFVGKDNLDMIAFVNQDIVDLSMIPQHSFFGSETSLQICVNSLSVDSSVVACDSEPLKMFKDYLVYNSSMPPIIPGVRFFEANESVPFLPNLMFYIKSTADMVVSFGVSDTPEGIVPANFVFVPADTWVFCKGHCLSEVKHIVQGYSIDFDYIPH